MASAPSSTSGTNPLATGAAGTGVGAAGAAASDASSPNQTKPPIASIAASLNTDSKAIASTSPRLCSVALALRVPNSIANRAIARATYSPLSCQAGTCALSPARAVSIEKLIATAFSCSAM